MRFTRLLSTILGFLVLTPLAARATTEITVGKARFQFISPTCVRMEYAPDGKFIDLPSIIAINRKFPNVGAGGSREIKDGEQTHIVVDGTEFTMNIIYIKGHAFDDQSLSIFMPPSTMCGGVGVGWKPSMVDDRNLGGTVSSLDGATGAQDMGMGLLSRNGWHVIDDSKSALLTPDGWFKKRETAEGYQDWVFFGYGHDYKQAFADFRAVCGAIPPLPAWAFGLWYSRYWTYSDQELRDIVTRFKTEGIPLSVQVVDVDWHLNGWEGFD